MSRKFFGTDGVRGIANKTLTPELVFQLGLSVARTLNLSIEPLNKTVIFGKDTRASGNMLDSALASGFMAAGWNVINLGIVPTPVVSYAVRNSAASLGAVISASHNPAPDNGVKFFSKDGSKLADDIESAAEQFIDSDYKDRPIGGEVGRIVTADNSNQEYSRFVSSLGRDYSGLKVAIDAANGAAYELGPTIFKKLGCEVHVIGADPDGININAKGGATKPNVIQDFTKHVRADIGIAFDGDADRVIFSDSQGRLVNGDLAMAIWAVQRKDEGLLKNRTVVGTVMSNGGFAKYLDSNGLKLLRAPVGDKYVSEKITESGAEIGGEQSGHIIFPAYGPTGDGILTAIQVINAVVASGKSIADWVDSYDPWPQLLLNLEMENPKHWQREPEIVECVEQAETELLNRGRVNIRPSGTQPMLRVMVEAENYELRDKVADDVLSAFIKAYAAKVLGKVDLTYALGD